LLSALVYVVLVALVVLTVLVGLRLRSAVDRSDRRDDALSAGRQQAVNLLSIDYRTATRDLQRIIDGSTGELKTSYEAQLKAAPALFAQTKGVQTCELVAAGVVTNGSKTAEIAIVANVTASSSDKANTLHSAIRMLLDMRYVHGHWLASKQTFVGLGTPL
jgi:Mce-associated membrane protein